MKFMSEIINKVQLAGSLPRDPDIRTFNGDKKMAKFSIGTPEYTNTGLGDADRQLQWHNAIAWGKTAEQVEQTLKKGKTVLVNGKLSSRTYLAKDGTKRYTTEVVVSGFELLK